LRVFVVAALAGVLALAFAAQARAAATGTSERKQVADALGGVGADRIGAQATARSLLTT